MRALSDVCVLVATVLRCVRRNVAASLTLSAFIEEEMVVTLVHLTSRHLSGVPIRTVPDNTIISPRRTISLNLPPPW